MDDNAALAAGWTRFSGTNAFATRNMQERIFIEVVGPMWSQPVENSAEERIRLGLQLGWQHMNELGKCHGGMMCTLLDTVIGLNAMMIGDGKAGMPTISLSVDFLAPADVGEWLETRVAILKTTKNICFGEGRLLSEGKIVARATAVFRRLTPK